MAKEVLFDVGVFIDIKNAKFQKMKHGHAVLYVPSGRCLGTPIEVNDHRPLVVQIAARYHHERVFGCEGNTALEDELSKAVLREPARLIIASVGNKDIVSLLPLLDKPVTCRLSAVTWGTNDWKPDDGSRPLWKSQVNFSYSPVSWEETRLFLLTYDNHPLRKTGAEGKFASV